MKIGKNSAFKNECLPIIQIFNLASKKPSINYPIFERKSEIMSPNCEKNIFLVNKHYAMEVLLPLSLPSCKIVKVSMERTQ